MLRHSQTYLLYRPTPVQMLRSIDTTVNSPIVDQIPEELSQHNRTGSLYKILSNFHTQTMWIGPRSLNETWI